jgi:hypothetical protein
MVHAGNLERFKIDVLGFMVSFHTGSCCGTVFSTSLVSDCVTVSILYVVNQGNDFCSVIIEKA